MNDPISALNFNCPGDVVGSGAYSTIFRPVASQRSVFKLFRGESNPANTSGTASRRFVFNSEVRAYKIAMADPDLKELVPFFHGVRRVNRVTDSGRDVSDRYLLDCCYAIDHVRGSWTKASGAPPDVMEYRRLFADRGIAYTDDCSYCRLENGRLVFIDFGIDDPDDLGYL